jgi:hypothetical protein
MKIIECTQGDIDWVSARIGKPTASEFHRIVTPTGKLSSQAKGYAYRLIAEALLNMQVESLEGLEWIEHGKASEADAVRIYEFIHEVETKPVGFITTDDGRVGCSPDRLVGKNGLEIKCPSPQMHIGYLMGDLGDKYKPQVQGQNFVGEFEYTDFFSHNVHFKPVEIRTYRDEEYIKILKDSLVGFCDMKDEMLEKIRKNGFFPEPQQVKDIVTAAYSENENGIVE